jgi:hypothetical protein
MLWTLNGTDLMLGHFAFNLVERHVQSLADARTTRRQRLNLNGGGMVGAEWLEMRPDSADQTQGSVRCPFDSPMTL